jgi:hypothetical protein
VKNGELRSNKSEEDGERWRIEAWADQDEEGSRDYHVPAITFTGKIHIIHSTMAVALR